MKSAVVFGARQQYGYEICAKLLEFGWIVYGIDHEKWQTEEKEDRWMGIGRNAHLQLMIIEQHKKNAALIDYSKNPHMYIIPVLDYDAYHLDVMHDQLILMLEHLSKLQQDTKPLFLFIQSAASKRNQSEFQQNLEILLEQMRRDQQHVIQYFLPSTHSHMFFERIPMKSQRKFHAIRRRIL